jgi:hypothetical protein
MSFDYTNGDAWITLGQMAGIAFGGYFLLLWLGVVLWTLRDIRARTNDTTFQAVATILVAVFFLPGWLLYLVIRPGETLADRYDRRIEEEAFAREIDRRQACPTCARTVSDDFIICPHCRTTLRVGCGACGRLLASGWVACPFCETPRRAPTRPAAVGSPSVVMGTYEAEPAPQPVPARNGARQSWPAAPRRAPEPGRTSPARPRS